MQSTVLRYLNRSFWPLLLLFTGSVSFSCVDGAEGADKNSYTPEVGSLFTMSVKQSVLGNPAPLESKLDVTLRVADMIFEGKEHVAQFSADTMISLIAYEANGDLSIYLRRERFGPSVVEGEWLRCPFRGSDSVSQLLRIVPNMMPDGKEDRSRIRWSARPAGVERVIVGGKEFEARKIDGVLSLWADSTESGTPTQSRQYTLWYAPELGYTVREQILSLVYSEDGADTLGTSRRELTSYSLK